MAGSSFELRTRVTLEELESQTLAPFATRSRGAHQTRPHPEPEHPYRTAFQRDRDRIVHSRAFRRLKHKRQVFLASEGDHYRTRITHTLEVAQLSRTIARTLGLNEDLTEAIALGHDLGHTPFGHLGEVVLHKIMTGASLFQGQAAGHNWGGFKHNYQSVRVVDQVERKYEFLGLNLTAPVREGMLKHTRLKRGDVDFPDFRYEGLYYDQDMATTLEGQVVAICDEIAQRTHDLEDGARAKLVNLEQMRELKIVQMVAAQNGIGQVNSGPAYVQLSLLVHGLINCLVDDVIQVALANLEHFHQRRNRLTSFDEELVHFSPALDPLQKELNKFIYQEIINFSRIKWSDELGEKLIFRLFEAYYRHPEMLPEPLLLAEFGVPLPALYVNREAAERLRHEPRFFRSVCDYIAGMSDSFAVREAERMAKQGHIQTDDLHLESALGNHI